MTRGVLQPVIEPGLPEKHDEMLTRQPRARFRRFWEAAMASDFPRVRCYN